VSTEPLVESVVSLVSTEPLVSVESVESVVSLVSTEPLVSVVSVESVVSVVESTVGPFVRFAEPVAPKLVSRACAIPGRSPPKRPTAPRIRTHKSAPGRQARPLKKPRSRRSRRPSIASGRSGSNARAQHVRRPLV